MVIMIKKLLLTSTGFGNKKFAELFLNEIGKPAERIKMIFVPTAAIDDDAREVLPKCYHDLTDAGINPQNIFTYDLRYLISHNRPSRYMNERNDVPMTYKLLSLDEICNFDAIYLSGGDTEYLLNEVNRTGFADVLKQAIENGVFYIGTSAGAIIAAGNLPNNLGYIKNTIGVHYEIGTPCGALPENQAVNLTNEQAIWIEGDSVEIIE